MSPFLRNVAILAVASSIVLVLNLEVAVFTIGVLVNIAFLIAIAVVIYFFWRDTGRREISTWSQRAQWVVYGAALLLIVDLGWLFLDHPSGRNALAFFVVAAICVFAGVRTWRDQRTYS